MLEKLKKILILGFTFQLLLISVRTSDAGRWRGAVVIGGDNLSSPGQNRVNLSAKYWGANAPPPASPVPASLSHLICNQFSRKVLNIYSRTRFLEPDF